MSKRTRLLEIMAASDLAEADVARARARGARDAAVAGGWANAASALVPALANAGGKAFDVAEANEMAKAQSLADSYQSTAGSGATWENTETGVVQSKYDQTPQELAAEAAGELRPKKTGNVIDDFFADPLGMKERAARAGQSGIAKSIQSARDSKLSKRQGEIDRETKARMSKAEIELKKAQNEAKRSEIDVKRADSADEARHRGVTEGLKSRELDILEGKQQEKAGADVANKQRSFLMGKWSKLNAELTRIQRGVFDGIYGPNPAQAATEARRLAAPIQRDLDAVKSALAAMGEEPDEIEGDMGEGAGPLLDDEEAPIPLGPPAGPSRVRVRLKATGETGSIPALRFNPAEHERIQ
jgi:hypothetical protein